jgi:hypothetical protein
LPKANQIESYQPGSIGWMRQLIEIVKWDSGNYY